MRNYHGYFNMGKPRFPPLPSFILMEDRVTGTIWALSREINEGVERVALRSEYPKGIFQHEVAFYRAFEGPYIAKPVPIRLLVHNGSLGYEAAEPPKVHSPRILTRKGVERRVSEIFLPAGFMLGDVLAVEVTDL
jgi:hypothetical protein